MYKIGNVNLCNPTKILYDYTKYIACFYAKSRKLFLCIMEKIAIVFCALWRKLFSLFCIGIKTIFCHIR